LLDESLVAIEQATRRSRTFCSQIDRRRRMSWVQIEDRLIHNLRLVQRSTAPGSPPTAPRAETSLHLSECRRFSLNPHNCHAHIACLRSIVGSIPESHGERRFCGGRE
jgi:hypothetical protein